MGRNFARALENGPSPPGGGGKLDRSSANQITGLSEKPDRGKINMNTHASIAPGKMRICELFLPPVINVLATTLWCFVPDAILHLNFAEASL